MTLVSFEFWSRELELTDDTVEGRPIIAADIWIGEQQVCRGEFALIDTGSNRTLINPVLLAGLEGLPTPQSVETQTIDAEQVSLRFNDCTVSIGGLRSFRMPIFTRHDLPAGMLVLIGRDLLAHYRMVYDPPSRTFTLDDGVEPQ